MTKIIHVVHLVGYIVVVSLSDVYSDVASYCGHQQQQQPFVFIPRTTTIYNNNIEGVLKSYESKKRITRIPFLSIRGGGDNNNQNQYHYQQQQPSQPEQASSYYYPSNSYPPVNDDSIPIEENDDEDDPYFDISNPLLTNPQQQQLQQQQLLQQQQQQLQQQQQQQQFPSSSSYPSQPYGMSQRPPPPNLQQQQHQQSLSPNFPAVPQLPPSLRDDDNEIMEGGEDYYDYDRDEISEEEMKMMMASDNNQNVNTASSTSPIPPDLGNFNKDYILKGLARLYRKKILPLELASRYGHFQSPPLSPSDFDAPPMILMIGQYSVGKTSFVKYLLGRDFPGIRIGPEPTTDRFTAIVYNPKEYEGRVVPGAALCSQTDHPFTGLNIFGNNFLSRIEGIEMNAPILKNITIIDTPGILSGQKQKSRNYDYDAVMKWFAERADLIIIMFDAHKLDISDELKAVIQLMIPHLDKIRIVLNKADAISTQQLLRVYGALMWSLGKVMNTPEVSRVYVGSFWDAPLQNIEQIDLLQREELDLLNDIMMLPQHAVMRRINELVKRARSVKVHAYIIHYLRKQLPYNPFSRRDKQKRLIGRLESEFVAAARRYSLPKGDFPSLEPMRQALYEIKDLSEYPKLDKKLIREMDKVFSIDIPELLERAKSQ